MEKPYDKVFEPSEEFLPINPPESDRKLNVTGLEPSTKYEFRVAGIARLEEDIPGPYATLVISTPVETGTIFIISLTY